MERTISYPDFLIEFMVKYYYYLRVKVHLLYYGKISLPFDFAGLTLVDITSPDSSLKSISKNRGGGNHSTSYEVFASTS